VCESVAERPRRRIVTRRVCVQAFYYAVAILLAVIVVIPLAWMVAGSLKDLNEAYALRLIPQHPTLDNYRTLFGVRDAPILRWFLNTVLVGGGGAVLLIAVVLPAAYAYARMDFWGRDVMFALLISTFLIPGIIFLVPNFLIVVKLGLLDTYWAVILPPLGGTFGVFFFRQFFLSLPAELEEAMLLDGANRFRILWSLVIPLSKGAMATIVVLTFLGVWNEILWTPLVLNDPNLWTLPVGLISFTGTYGSTNPGVVMAGVCLATLPMVGIFFAMQRFIVESVASVAIKG